MWNGWRCAREACSRIALPAKAGSRGARSSWMNQSELSMEQIAERIVPTQIGEKVLPEGVNLILRSETGTAPARAITFIPNYSSP